MVQPSVRRFAASKTPDLGAIDFDDANLRKRIAVETIERKAKQMAIQGRSLESKAKYLKMLENFERMILDLQSSKSVLRGDRAVLGAGLDKLKIRKHSVEDDMATLVQSRMLHGPRTCLFYQENYNGRIVCTLLTSLRADMKDVWMLFLCEEPGHQHKVDDCYVRLFNGALEEDVVQKVQALLGRGLGVVASVLSVHCTGQLGGLDCIRRLALGSEMTWDLGALDLEKHGKPTENGEDADVLKRIEDSAAEWILREHALNGESIFKYRGLLRVRYKVTEKGDSPGYTRGSVAWLCKVHADEGLISGILELYPVKFYNPELN